MKTKVIFKMLEGEVIALFPELAGDMNPYKTCLSYVHLGQHGSASVELSSLKAAKPSEYQNLFWELIGIGYELEVVHKFSRKMLQKRIMECGA
jgi:hypothetical protein